MRREASRRLRRAVYSAAAFAVAAFGSVVLPAVGHAHGALRRSSPSAEARVAEPLQQLVLEFTEAVETRFVRVTARDAAGRELGNPTLRFSEDRRTVTVVDTALATLRGTVVVSWRIAGADGHPVEGSFQFTVEAPQRAAAVAPDTGASASAAEAARGEAPDPGEASGWGRVDGPAATSLRVLLYVALLGLIGGWAAQVLILPRAASLVLPQALPESLLARTQRLTTVAAAATLVVLHLRVVAQASALGIAGAGGIADLVFGTAWGRGWLAASAGAVLAAGLGHRGTRAPAVLGAAIAAVTFGVAGMGHAAAAPSAATAVLTDAAHQLGAGIWIGSLLWLAAVALPATSGNPEVRGHLTRAFSSTALAGAALLGLSGAWNAWRYVGSVDAMLVSDYGRVLGLKLLALALVALTGLYNWRAVVPRVETEAGARRLRLTSAVELLVAVVVLIITARLVITEVPSLTGP